MIQEWLYGSNQFKLPIVYLSFAITITMGIMLRSIQFSKILICDGL